MDRDQHSPGKSKQVPKWNDPELKAGTMIKSALWLLSEVGVGNTFTKEQHRMAFAGIAQADRRMRDLRSFGWVIHTSTEDVSLNPEEQRLVTVGVPVWESKARKAVKADALSAKKRRAVFAESNYQCSICGVAGGERYPDDPETVAVLAISRLKIVSSEGHASTAPVAECKRCRAGGSSQPVDLSALVEAISQLDDPERTIFVSWMVGNRRHHLEVCWANFKRLPKDAQDQVRLLIKDGLTRG